MKIVTLLHGIWGTRLWTSLLVLAAFAAGIRWQQHTTSPSRLLDDVRPSADVEENRPIPAQGPTVLGPKKVLTGPDVVRVVTDFAPIEALMVGCSDLITHHQPAFVEIARALSEADVPMIALVSDARQGLLCEQALEQAGIDLGKVYLIQSPLNTMWVRDFGPFFVERDDRSIGIVDASYSAGFDNSTDRWRDDEFPIVLSEVLKLPLNQIPLRMAGGNLLSNGEGLLLSSTDLALGNRSRGYTIRKTAMHLKHFFSVGQWLYVKPAVGEPTKHVDMFVTLLGPDLAVVAQADEAADPANVAILDEAAAFLAQVHTSSGPIQVHRIPQPPPKDRLFRSYTNIIIANSVVLVPVFTDVDPALQEAALQVYRELMPDRKIIGINADSLQTENGLLRCISLGIPQGVDWRRMLSWDMDADQD